MTVLPDLLPERPDLLSFLQDRPDGPARASSSLGRSFPKKSLREMEKVR
jgi:hypothetical protein